MMKRSNPEMNRTDQIIPQCALIECCNQSSNLKLNISHSDCLLLASASPRRAELLTAAGIAFEVRPADVDEAVHDGERPDQYVVRVAIDKARRISATHPDRVVLGADTTVVVDGVILAKPV